MVPEGGEETEGKASISWITNRETYISCPCAGYFVAAKNGHSCFSFIYNLFSYRSLVSFLPFLLAALELDPILPNLDISLQSYSGLAPF